MNQAEQRDGTGRITVEASIIHVIRCGSGEQFYIYQYVNRPGFRAIRPPHWGAPLGGRDFVTFGDAVGAATAQPTVSTPKPGTPPPTTQVPGIVAATPKAPPPTAPAPKPTPPPQDYRAWMTGTFDTGGGVLKLSPAGGTYEYSNGRMSNVRIEGPVMEGRWEQDSSGRKCPDGRYHGRFRLTFSENSFTGLFGYCDEEPARRGGFQGTRRKL